MRPEVSEEVREEVEALTEGEFSVPTERVRFEDRLRVLVELAKDGQQPTQSMASSNTLNATDPTQRRR